MVLKPSFGLTLKATPLNWMEVTMKSFKKFKSTLNICVTLFVARMFGKYEHSLWDGKSEYAQYRLMGASWLIPLTPVQEESQ